MKLRATPGNPPEVSFTEPAPIADLMLAVVTPMFGGGFQPGETDPELPIHPATIRGHLRFWWRACNARAGKYDTPEKLFSDESKFWGATALQGGASSGPSAIDLDVMIESTGTAEFSYFGKPDYRWRGANGWAPPGVNYALFPFNGLGDSHAANGREGVVFRLRLTPSPSVGLDPSVPSLSKCRLAAEQALWAWITFGGVGARTRRGCGTLRCQGGLFMAEEPDEEPMTAEDLFMPPEDSHAIEEWIYGAVESYVLTGGGVTAVPSLAGGSFAVKPNPPYLANPPGAMDAWGTAIDAMRSFRQGPGIGRVDTGNPMHPGESYWPEAGAVRRLLGFGGHYVRNTAGGGDFPRADLGLPMGFGQMRNPAPQLTVNREGSTRMASPVILKALPIGETEAVPLALLLDAPHVWDVVPDAPSRHLKLEGNGRETTLNAQSLTGTRHAWRLNNWRGAHGSGGAAGGTPAPMYSHESARDAFCHFVAEEWGVTSWTLP